MREKERYLLHQDKKIPKHCVKHKLHITKVMFLCAVARPHFNPCSNSWWDSKLGIWTIGDWELAKWKSKNRPKGTLVWKTRLLLRKFIMIYSFPSSFHPSWRNGLGGTCCQGKFSFIKMGQKITLVVMTSYSMTCSSRIASMQHSALKQQTRLMSIYWI